MHRIEVDFTTPDGKTFSYHRDFFMPKDAQRISMRIFEISRETQRDSDSSDDPRTVRETQEPEESRTEQMSQQETINRNVRRAWDAEFNGIDPREIENPYDA